MEQIVDTVPGLPTLDAPVPLMAEHLVDVLRFFDTQMPSAEQAVDVPKIIVEDIPTRIFREPQLAEQSVEVPTILYFLKQKVDIPVPGGGGRLADLQGFHPEQNPTVQSAEQLVDLPVPGGGLQGFRPGQGSTASSSCSHSPAGVHEDANEPDEGGFCTCPRPEKSAKVTRTRVRECPGTSAHHAERSSNGSGVSESHDEDAVWYDEEREQAWCRRSYWHLLTT